MFAGTSVRAARFKLAHALKGLSTTLQNTENFADASSPVLFNLADNIGTAVNKLKNSTVNPFYAHKNNHALPLGPVNNKVKKKGPGPRCEKSLKKVEENGVVPQSKDSGVLIHAHLDLSEKNKIWLVPKIKLTDILKGKVIKTECQ